MRQLAGVILKDLPRYIRLLSRRDAPAYLGLCNRNEYLVQAPDDSGFRCDWKWTSDLHAPKHLPFLGKWLVARALADHPIRFVDSGVPSPSEPPQVSFIIGHRGAARLPHLIATLASIAAQSDHRYECIVVEQDTQSVIGSHLPSWVTKIHTPPPDAAMPYCRSWAFNVGARAARGRVLVLHDNDLLVPVDYVSTLLTRFEDKYDVVNLKRFIFYLSERQTSEVLAQKGGIADAPPAAIMQNTEGGGSVAITCEAYERIGGMDESFIGWGGEDNEFWDRAVTLRAWCYGYLPMAHLWHAPQPGKNEAGHTTKVHYDSLSRISPQDRIDALSYRSRGRLEGPHAFSPVKEAA